MQAIHFDRDGREIPAHEASLGSNLTNFCSWRRLWQTLRESGELRPNETLVSFQVDDRGITYRVRSS